MQISNTVGTVGAKKTLPENFLPKVQVLRRAPKKNFVRNNQISRMSNRKMFSLRAQNGFVFVTM